MLNCVLASKQLQQVSLRLVKESFGDAMYSKALSCIKKLREEAIGVSTLNITLIFIDVFVVFIAFKT